MGKKKVEVTDSNIVETGQEKSGTNVPPALVETAESLKAEAAKIVTGPMPIPGKRGRHPKGCVCGRCGASTPASETPSINWPVETLKELHKANWKWIAERLKSKFILSDKGAEEMAICAQGILNQYVTPMIGEHSSLAGYLLCQVTALSFVIAEREKPVKKESNEVPVIPIDVVTR